MFKIKDFASIFNISIKTVRYYESIGLIIPKYINKYTGYRYYDEDNVYTMQDILSLKNLGFSLEEIKYFNKDSIKNKIDNYEKEILNLQDKISILKQFYITEENNNKMIFVNDEKAIGKWVLQGVCENFEEAQKENYIQDDYNIKELYLLPNGEDK